MAQARAQWRRAQPALALELLVFVDESGTRTDLTRRYGRAAPGQRLVEAVPAGHWRVLTLGGALRLDGRTACMTLAGAVDQDRFVAYAEQVLAPMLAADDVVIMDNLSSHGGGRVRAAVKAQQARLVFLPAYSPDLSPIEQMWAKLKQSLRAAKARSTETLEAAIAAALATVTAEDAREWFAACGYAHNQ